jgi:hypothetical protein
MLKKIGAEAILGIILAPFFIWVTSSIYNLQAGVGTSEKDTKEIKEIVKSIEIRSQKMEIDIALIKARVRE